MLVTCFLLTTLAVSAQELNTTAPTPAPTEPTALPTLAPTPRPTPKPSLWPTYNYNDYYPVYPRLEDDKGDDRNKHSSSKRGGTAVGGIVNGFFAVSLVTAIGSTVGLLPRSPSGLRSAMRCVVGVAILGQLAVVQSSPTSAATFLRRLTRQFRWLVFQWGDVTKNKKNDDEEDDDDEYRYDEYEFDRRKLLDTSSAGEGCKTRRLADVFITMVLIVVAAIVLHVVLFSTTMALKYAAAGASVGGKPREMCDAAVLWPRTLWPFAPYGVVAIALGAGGTLGLTRCWETGWAFLGLGVFLLVFGLYAAVLFLKIATHLPDQAKFVELPQDGGADDGGAPTTPENDVALDEKTPGRSMMSSLRTTTSTMRGAQFKRIATPGALTIATTRAFTMGEPLYNEFASGEWQETTSRFLASHGAAFEDYLPRVAMGAEFILFVPEIIAAFVIGIARKNTSAQAWIVFFLTAFLLIYVAGVRPFANHASNAFEIISSTANCGAGFFLAVAASAKDRKAENAAFAVAGAMELLGLVLVVGLQASAGCAVATHSSIRALKQRRNADKTIVSDDDVNAAAGVAVDVTRADDQPMKALANDIAVDAAASNAAHLVILGATLTDSLRAACSSPDFSFGLFAKNFATLSLDELRYIGLWTISFQEDKKKMKPQDIDEDDDDDENPAPDDDSRPPVDRTVTLKSEPSGVMITPDHAPDDDAKDHDDTNV